MNLSLLLALLVVNTLVIGVAVTLVHYKLVPSRFGNIGDAVFRGSIVMLCIAFVSLLVVRYPFPPVDLNATEVALLCWTVINTALAALAWYFREVYEDRQRRNQRQTTHTG